MDQSEVIIRSKVRPLESDLSRGEVNTKETRVMKLVARVQKYFRNTDLMR